MAKRLEELLGTEEVAGYLGVGQVTVYRRCRKGSGGRPVWVGSDSGRRCSRGR